MSGLSVRLLTGGSLSLQSKGRLLLQALPSGELVPKITDVSWWSTEAVLSFVRSNTVGADDAERWANAMRGRVPAPWATLRLAGALSVQDVVHTMQRLLKAREGCGDCEALVSPQQATLRDSGDVVATASRASSMVGRYGLTTVCLHTANKEFLLASIGALINVGCEAVILNTLDGIEEEFELTDLFSVRCALELLGVGFPLPASLNWCGLPQLYVRPSLGDEVGKFAIPF